MRDEKFDLPLSIPCKQFGIFRWIPVFPIPLLPSREKRWGGAIAPSKNSNGKPWITFAEYMKLYSIPVFGVTYDTIGAGSWPGPTQRSSSGASSSRRQALLAVSVFKHIVNTWSRRA